VVIADDSLVPVPAAGVLQGITDKTVILINSRDSGATWQHRLNTKSSTVVLPETEETEDRIKLRYIGATCAGGAAGLLGVISRDILAEAVIEELGHFSKEVVAENTANALTAYDYVLSHVSVRVTEGRAVMPDDYTRPQWVDIPFEDARISAPIIHGGLTSVAAQTGLWRTMRPVIDYSLCRGCWWVCSTFCPDGAIDVKELRPVIDYDHCKGCLVCVAQCPSHAIEAVPESEPMVEGKTTSGESS
jgi:pyruvate ferredoxin oxidoreductase gamma subunit